MSVFRNPLLDLLVPTPIPACIFVCGRCLKGSGSGQLFTKVEKPPPERDCQSCGRPVERISARPQPEEAQQQVKTIGAISIYLSTSADGGGGLLDDTSGEPEE